MSQVWTIKLTESKNTFCISDRVLYTIKLNTREAFIGFMRLIDSSQRMKDLLLDKYSM